MFLNCNRQSSSIDSSRNIFSVTLFWAGMFSVCKFNISFAYFRTPKAFEHVYSASVVSTSLSLILELYCFFTSESQIQRSFQFASPVRCEGALGRSTFSYYLESLTCLAISAFRFLEALNQFTFDLIVDQGTVALEFLNFE